MQARILNSDHRCAVLQEVCHRAALLYKFIEMIVSKVSRTAGEELQLASLYPIADQDDKGERVSMIMILRTIGTSTSLTDHNHRLILSPSCAYRLDVGGLMVPQSMTDRQLQLTQ
ncbi:hypothetical protein C8Q74DRAFT_134401 [Fomes fomentarius]|nr:hypothetical protein C8Q74DRAFT_134401 [Fomes fomentarius]